MSKRMESATAMIEALRPYVLVPGLPILGALEQLLQPSAGALRQRKLEAKKRVRSGVRSDSGSDAGSDAPPPSLPPAPLFSPSESSQNQGNIPILPPELSLAGSSKTATGRAEAESDLTFELMCLRDAPKCTSHGIADLVAVRIADVTGKRWSATDKWHRDLVWIAQQPLLEFTNVLRALAADEWVRTHSGAVTPGHICKHWPRYSDGPKQQPSRFERVYGPGEVSADFDESQNPEWANG